MDFFSDPHSTRWLQGQHSTTTANYEMTQRDNFYLKNLFTLEITLELDTRLNWLNSILLMKREEITRARYVTK